MNLSIVLSTHAAKFAAVVFRGDLASNLARIAHLGYDGVELAIRDPKLVDAQTLSRLAAQHKLVISAIGTGQAWGEEGLSYTDPDQDVRAAAIERSLAHIPLAAETGAIVILGLLRGVLQPGISRPQAMGWIVSALDEICDAAERKNVRIALEPINRYETPFINRAEEGMELLRQVGAPNLGLLLDTFHMNIEEPIIEESIRACGNHIYHFHVADSNRWYPGAGHLDFATILGALGTTGYRGFVSAEYVPLPDAASSAAHAIAHLRQAGARSES